MDAVLTLLKLPPGLLLSILVLTVIGGLGYIIYLLIKQGRNNTPSNAELASNHLHALPEMLETLRRMERQQAATAAALLGQLADMRETLAWIRARVERRAP